MLRSARAGLAVFKTRPAEWINFRSQRLDLPCQLGPAPVDARLHRAFGDAKLIGDFLIRQLVNIAQQHRGAKRRRQRAQRFAQQRHPILQLDSRIRVEPRRFGLDRGRVDLAREHLAIAAAAAIAIDADSSGSR